jgi:adenine-specific DNA-methyltransferase
VLKLLREELAGGVKMIYIDPPYNTGGDFVYCDRFPASHADWLSMMLPRLMVARDLLSEDGAIFVSIDDHEVHHLRLLMDEVFGEGCFRNCIIFGRGVKSVQAQFETVGALTVGHEYVLLYAKSPAARFRKLELPRAEAKPGTWNNHWRGTNRPTMRYELFGITPERGQWRWSRERSVAAIANYKRLLRDLGDSAVTPEQIDAWHLCERQRTGSRVDLLRLSATGRPEHYVPPAETRLGSDLWTDISPRGSAELRALFGTDIFDNPKPVALIRRMLQFVTEPHGGDVVLDFFAGSCSTAHAVLEQNRDDGGDRRFVMVQSPEPLDPPRTLADGTVLRTIAEIGRERIRRVVATMGRDNDGKRDRAEIGAVSPIGRCLQVFRLTEPGAEDDQTCSDPRI